MFLMYKHGTTETDATMLSAAIAIDMFTLLIKNSFHK